MAGAGGVALPLPGIPIERQRGESSHQALRAELARCITTGTTA